MDTLTHCTRSIALSIEVKALPVVTVSTDKTICLGECVTLTATGGHTYQWSTGAVTPSVTFCPPASRDVHVTISNSDGCSVVRTIHVEVLPLPLPVVTEDTVCQGESASLMASGGVSYLWDNGLTSPTIQVSPLHTTQYTVTVTGVNGCKASAGTVALVKPLPPADAGADQSICQATCTLLSATGGDSYAWSTGSGLQAIEVCPSSGTHYTVTVTGSNGCSASDQVYVEVRPLPLASAGADQFVCEGLGATLNATGGLGYAWSTHHVMNKVAQGKLNANSLDSMIVANQQKFPPHAMLMQFTSNHDENSWNGTEQERLGDARKVMAVLTANIPGLPLIY
ncbi:MAG: hypothetical protein EOM24_32240, partial [Chloroflexia bacterium]|nr:hypothetical protein [Chloroflexia bacterium]